jgi:hypothetical protein
MPPWLTKFLNDHVQQTAMDEIKTRKIVKMPMEYGSSEGDSCGTPSATLNATSISSAPFEDMQRTVILPGLECALREIRRLLRDKLQDETRSFNGVCERTPNGWQVLKFKTNRTRTCLNGHQHVKNQFNILSNGVIFVYRCLSLECIDRPNPFLGTFFWPECLPLRLEGELFGTCERYMIPFERPADEGDKKKKVKEDERMKRAKSDLHDFALRIMNHYFAVVRSTKAIYLETIAIYLRDANGELCPKETIDRSGRDFLEVCRNFQLQSLPGKSNELAKYWESSPKRREYDEIVFEPDLSKVSSRQFNMFNGLRFQPIDRKLTKTELRECEEHMPKLMWHFGNIVCDGSEERFDYNVRWLAHAVQRPWKKIGVALVFRGGQGSGKSVVFTFFEKEILGAKNYLYSNEIAKVIGKFNSLGANKLLIVLDEAGNWGGAYRMNDRMKSQITQEETCLERKGRDAISVQDKSNIVFTTNNFWPVKREADDRRYSCRQCSYAKMGDMPYSDALVEELEKSETTYHFHRYLSSIDIANWDPQKMSITAWGEGLKEHSIPPHVNMMQALLENGCFHPSLKTWVASSDIKRTYDTFLLQMDIKEDRHVDVNILMRFLGSIFNMRPQARSIKGVQTHKGWWFTPHGAICEALHKGKLLSSTVEWMDTWQRLDYTKNKEGPWMTDPKALQELVDASNELRQSLAKQKCSFCSNTHLWEVRRDETGNVVTRDRTNDDSSKSD